MSTSIHGWIEIYLPIIEEWAAITNISLLVEQNYNAYGCLFGVRNYSNFVPIAAERGVPMDASDVFKNETTDLEYYNYPSWISFNEIESMDWEESVIDAHVHVYKRLENGEYATSSSAGYVPNKPFNRRVGDVWVAEGKDARFYDNGELHKVERITRRDALRAFKVVFDIMAILAKQNGSENVRLVVWFD
jgi:hypothetical protein